MPRLLKLRGAAALSPLVRPLAPPPPTNPLASIPTPHEHLRSISAALPPNIRLEDISKGHAALQDLSVSSMTNSRGRRRNVIWDDPHEKEKRRVALHGDNRLTKQQEIIAKEKRLWPKEDLKQLKKRGGLLWALRER